MCCLVYLYVAFCSIIRYAVPFQVACVTQYCRHNLYAGRLMLNAQKFLPGDISRGFLEVDPEISHVFYGICQNMNSPLWLFGIQRKCGVPRVPRLMPPPGSSDFWKQERKWKIPTRSFAISHNTSLRISGSISRNPREKSRARALKRTSVRGTLIVSCNGILLTFFLCDQAVHQAIGIAFLSLAMEPMELSTNISWTTLVRGKLHSLLWGIL